MSSFTINALIESPSCSYKVSKDITAFNSLYVLLGDEKKILPQNLTNNIEQYGHHVEHIAIPPTNERQKNVELLMADAPQIYNSDVIFISKERLYSVLPVLEEYKAELIGTGEASLVVITNQNKQITEKILTPVLRTISFPQTYLVNEQEFTDLMI